MKKILSLFLVMSLLMGVGAVVAETNNQGAEGNVVANFNIIFNPQILNFDNLAPGESDSLANTIIGTTSNLEITLIQVAPNIGTIFNENNVMFSNDDVAFVSAASFVAAPISIPAQGEFDFFVQMNIPVGTLSGPYAGTITYTVMEDVV